jgi:hypothetical protein
VRPRGGEGRGKCRSSVEETVPFSRHPLRGTHEYPIIPKTARTERKWFARSTHLHTHSLSLSLSLCLSFLIALFRTRHTHTHTPAYYARTHRRSSLSRCIWPIHARVFRSQQCGRRGTSVRTRKTSRASGGARLSSVETRSISPREILSAPPPLPHPRAAFPLAGRRIATRGSSLLDLTYDRSRGLSTFGQRRAVRGRRTPVLDLPRANRQSRNG